MLTVSLCTCALLMVTAISGIAQDIRLISGSANNEGRVEVFRNRQWQTVCDDGWGLNDANVACRQLGYGYAIRAVTHAHYGPGTGGQWEVNILCTGRERRLQDCAANTLSFKLLVGCSHSEDAGVICATSSLQQGSLRLAGSSFYATSLYAGRLEIYVNGRWGTVCDDFWGNNETNVACRQMGFEGAYDSDWILRSSGSISQTIWLDDVNCTGNESQLISCSHRGLGVEDCGHYEDVGIRCNRLETSTLPTESVTISTASMTGIIVGAVIAAVFLCGLLCIIICIVVVCCTQRRKRARRTARAPDTTTAGTTLAVAMVNQQPQQQQVMYQPQPDYQQQQGGYPPQPDYQQQQGGYPPQPDYQQQQGGYPSQPDYQQKAGYPPQPDYHQQGGYPPQPDYQQQQGGYSPKLDYQEQQGGYPSKLDYHQKVDYPGQQPAPVPHYPQPINFSN